MKDQPLTNKNSLSKTTDVLEPQKLLQMLSSTL